MNTGFTRVEHNEVMTCGESAYWAGIEGGKYSDHEALQKLYDLAYRSAELSDHLDPPTLQQGTWWSSAWPWILRIVFGMSWFFAGFTAHMAWSAGG